MDYAISRQYTGATPLRDVKFILAIGPDDVVTKCHEAVPRCFWKQKAQKIMWKLDQMPAVGVTAESPDEAYFGSMVCKLDTTSAIKPSAMQVTFAAETPTTLSGLQLIQPDADADISDYHLGTTHYALKSGLFEVL
jgi:hypothetical protein